MLLCILGAVSVINLLNVIHALAPLTSDLDNHPTVKIEHKKLAYIYI